MASWILMNKLAHLLLPYKNTKTHFDLKAWNNKVCHLVARMPLFGLYLHYIITFSYTAVCCSVFKYNSHKLWDTVTHCTPQNICLLNYDIININCFWAGRGLETETQVTWKAKLFFHYRFETICLCFFKQSHPVI